MPSKYTKRQQAEWADGVAEKMASMLNAEGVGATVLKRIYPEGAIYGGRMMVEDDASEATVSVTWNVVEWGGSATREGDYRIQFDSAAGTKTLRVWNPTTLRQYVDAIVKWLQKRRARLQAIAESRQNRMRVESALVDAGFNISGPTAAPGVSLRPGLSSEDYFIATVTFKVPTAPDDEDADRLARLAEALRYVECHQIREPVVPDDEPFHDNEGPPQSHRSL